MSSLKLIRDTPCLVSNSGNMSGRSVTSFGSEGSLRFFRCLSTGLLDAAAVSAERAKTDEQEAASRGGHAVNPHLVGSVGGAVFLSAAAVEASANEYFDRVVRGEITPPNSESLKELWENSKEPDPTNKGRFIPIKMKLERIHKDVGGVESIQGWDDLKALITLRNSLVHYKVKPLRDSEPDPYDLRPLLSSRFAECSFAAPSWPYFPDRCISAGCADWAANSARTFLRASMKALRLADVYDGGKNIAAGS